VSPPPIVSVTSVMSVVKSTSAVVAHTAPPAEAILNECVAVARGLLLASRAVRDSVPESPFAVLLNV